jgi:hypothetical protein
MATQAELQAGFAAARTAIDALIQAKVPAWAQGMIGITDSEIHAVSDPVVLAAEAARTAPPQQGT